MIQLSKDKIQDLIKQFIKKSIEKWEEKFLGAFDDNDPPPYSDSQTFHSYYNELNSIKEDLILNMHLGDYSMLETTVDQLLKENGIEADKDSLEYRKFCIAIHDAQIKLLPLEQKHMMRDLSYKDELPELFPDVFPKLNETSYTTNDQSGELLSKVIEKHVAEAGVNWTNKTKGEALSSFNLLLEIMGDVPIQSIDRKKMGEFKQTLMKLLERAE